MKKLLFVLFLFSGTLQAQIFVDGKNINKDEKIKLCQITASGKLFSDKVTIKIDYGRNSKMSKVTGKNGKPKKFNSIIDAMNFFENNGWTFIDSYVLTTGESDSSGSNIRSVSYYTFRKNETSEKKEE